MIGFLAPLLTALGGGLAGGMAEGAMANREAQEKSRQAGLKEVEKLLQDAEGQHPKHAEALLNEYIKLQGNPVAGKALHDKAVQNYTENATVRQFFDQSLRGQPGGGQAQPQGGQPTPQPQAPPQGEFNPQAAQASYMRGATQVASSAPPLPQGEAQQNAAALFPGQPREEARASLSPLIPERRFRPRCPPGSAACCRPAPSDKRRRSTPDRRRAKCPHRRRERVRRKRKESLPRQPHPLARC